MKELVVLLAALCASGCATSPVSSQSAERAPADRVVSQSLTTQSEGTHEVVVTRDKGFMSSACATEVYADGTQAAKLRTGERVSLYLSEGEHIIGAKPSGICGGGTAQIEIAVTPGKVQKLRVAYGQAGDLKIEKSAF